MVRGPLVPGWTEFDGPRRRVPRVVWAVVVLTVVVGLTIFLVGVFRAAGPLSALGRQTTPVESMAYRPTTDDAILQVALSVPVDSMCRGDDVQVTAKSDADRIRITSVVSRLRNAACIPDPTMTNPLWIDVRIDGPLAGREVVRATDGNALPLQATTGTTG